MTVLITERNHENASIHETPAPVSYNSSDKIVKFFVKISKGLSLPNLFL